MNVLIVYYSTYGNVYQVAKLVAEGVRQVKGVEPVVRRVFVEYFHTFGLRYTERQVSS